MVIQWRICEQSALLRARFLSIAGTVTRYTMVTALQTA